jgi:mono/diheme cytochrome c family protein
MMRSIARQDKGPEIDLTSACVRFSQAGRLIKKVSARMKTGSGLAFWRMAAAGLVGLVAAGLPPSEASAQGWGDAAAGKAMAELWCAECHMVAPDQQRTLVDVPTFMEIAERVNGDFAVIEGFLIDPHPAMPEMSLTRQEIRDLIAYFATLR